MKTVTSPYVKEQYYYFKHKSGLPVYVYPKEGYQGTYAIFGTDCGSVDDCFKVSDETDFTQVPAGIAHFLEHKLFECEDGDAFSRYAKTGASANAYTSFDKTCYLFTCSENLEQSLEILLDFVTAPYFTPETVQKEQGIIGQEIRMYDDNPDWQVFFGLLKALYVKNPIKNDIAGTVESIADITADVLYRCYEAFYNLNNMALCVVGNVTPEFVEGMADRMLKSSKDVTVECFFEDEPLESAEKRVEKVMSVGLPLFQMGYKLPMKASFLDTKSIVASKVFLEMLVGESSALYRSLLDEKLINAQFGYELMDGRGFAALIMGGESNDPDAVFARINSAVEAFKSQDINTEEFERARKTIYGHMVSGFNSIERIGGAVMENHFGGKTVFDSVEEAVKLTPADIKAFLDCLKLNAGAVSIIRGA